MKKALAMRTHNIAGRGGQGELARPIGRHPGWRVLRPTAISTILRHDVGSCYDGRLNEVLSGWPGSLGSPWFCEGNKI
jgi:hypothetical protein